MKKYFLISLTVLTLLAGCGTDMTNRGPDPIRKDGGRVRSGETPDAGSTVTNGDAEDSDGCARACDAYPEKLPDNAVWTEYPDDNLFNLRAIASGSDQDTSTVILAFAHLDGPDFDDGIIRNADSVQGMCPYGYFQFDENKVLKQDEYYYVKLCFDSRIELTTVMFDKGDERCNIGIKDTVDLCYCDFRNLENTRRLRQTYDPDSSAWSDVNEELKDETPKEDSGSRQYTELAIDSNEYEPSSEKNGVIFTAYDYRYTQPQHNIYGEIQQNALTSLKFFLLCDNDTPEEQDHFKLYQKTDSGYTEITPYDCTIETKADNDGHRLWVDMQSNLLGDMQEGDYRAEYGDYSVDFRLSVQTFEVW